MFVKKSAIFSIPNIITIIRIVSIPYIIWLLHNAPIHHTYYLWAVIVFSLAFITDQLDGYLSRVLNQRTTLGEILDPIADKIIVLCVLVQLTYMHLIPAWITMVLLTREVLINGLRAFSQTRGLSILPSMAGKIKVYFQGFGLGFLMMSDYIPLSQFPIQSIGMVLIVISMVLSVYSALDYVQKLILHLNRQA